MKKTGLARVGWMLGILLVLCAWSFSSWAADYPTRPINFWVGFQPGGVSDIQARALATAVEPILGQPFVVTNKAGATGAVMMAALAASKPDGYTIGITPGSLALVPHFQEVSFDLTKDFTYVCALSTYSEAITTLTDAPWKTLKDLIEYARKNPNQVKVATPGIGSSARLMAEVIGKQAGIQWTLIPFKGGTENVTALLGGHVHASTETGAHIPQVRAGKVRILANGTDERVKEFPDAPTLKELGYNYSALSLCGIVGPRGLPEPILRRLEEAFLKATNDKAYQDCLHLQALNPSLGNGKDFERRILELYKYVGEYVKK